MRRILHLRAIAALLTALAGCDTVSEMVVSNPPQAHTERASLAPCRISSGREGHRSPVGHFHITRKDIGHRSSLYGAYVDDANRIIKVDVDTRRDPMPRHAHFVGAPMPYFVEFAPGYGLHQGHLPGEPASACPIGKRAHFSTPSESAHRLQSSRRVSHGGLGEGKDAERRKPREHGHTCATGRRVPCHSPITPTLARCHPEPAQRGERPHMGAFNTIRSSSVHTTLAGSFAPLRMTGGALLSSFN